MSFSVNTNAGALLALQNLNKTSSLLSVAQKRINTGLKVASAKDNAAVYNIAQGLRSDVAGLNAVKSSIDRAVSATDVAIAAAEAVQDLLIEMKEKAVAASPTDLDAETRSALNDEFVELRNSISTIVENAEFNGINVLKSNQVSAIVNSDGSNSITVATQNMDFVTGSWTLGDRILNFSSTQNLSDSASYTFVGSTYTSTVSHNNNAQFAIEAMDVSIEELGSALAKLGSGSRRLEMQRSFTDKLSDSIEIGIGNLVDADLAKESATLQSLQVRQQLGLQALSIANQAPNTVLSLFG